MNEIAKARDIETITTEIRVLHRQAQGLLLCYAVEIGRRLVEAKELLPYGEWGSYLKEKVEFSQSTANNFMRLYEEYGAAQLTIFGAETDSQALGNLSYSKALALLAVPSEEREDFVRNNDVENLSTRELERLIRERDEARAKAQEAEARAEQAMRARENSSAQIYELQKKLDQAREDYSAAESDAARLEKELEELRNRPIDVAVQEPDPEAVKKAVDEALADAKAKFEADKKKLQDKLEAIEKKRDKLEQEVKKAEAAKAAAEETAKKKEAEASNVISLEKEKLEREIEGLKKQIAMTDTATTEFKVIFSGVQTDLQKMLEIIGGAPAETAEKLRKALEALLDVVRKKLDER